MFFSNAEGGWLTVFIDYVLTTGYCGRVVWKQTFFCLVGRSKVLLPTALPWQHCRASRNIVLLEFFK